jgi:voltage-gated potassium channel
MINKQKLYDIIFEADTRAGRRFDLALIWVICLSIVAVMLESVPSIQQDYYRQLRILEWVITIMFTLEYVLRIYLVKKPFNYVFSFYGIVDFLSILPTFLGLVFAGTQGLVVIRAIRLLRIFRILKISRYLNESNILMQALKASRVKISVFLFSVLTIVIVIGTLMYMIEGEQNGFSSIPKGIYWAIVTLTTVGYGDITPQTPLGQFVSSLVMILGYGIIAVPTGIVSVEMHNAYNASRDNVTSQVCPNCLREGHEKDAAHCKFCGEKLNV